jgi:hypothetical protein
MELSLQPEEATLLRHILGRYLSDLRTEVAGTESYEMRQELKRDETLINQLIARLEQAGVTAS